MLLALWLAAATATPAPPTLSLAAEKLTLDNGLVVIASTDHTVPGVAVNLWYRVGSRDEQPGRTGFAHLFEHLMFMGAKYAPYPRFDTIMEAWGGTNNAFTSQDVTDYFEVGPTNLLETFFWLEGDRLATLDRTMDAEKLAAQRLVVQNERRQSYENRPYGLAALAVEEQVYPPGHPYSWSPIGSHRDLEAATVDDVVRFFRTHYVPNNAVLTVVGDVEPGKVFALARTYLGFIPRRELPARAAPPAWVMPAEKRVPLEDQVEVPKAILAWPSPAGMSQGDAEADLLATLLGHGKSSRLYRRLVHDDQLATTVQVRQSSGALGSTFVIEAVAAPGHTTAQLVAAIDDELARLLARGPTAAEVESARALMESDLARRLQTLGSRALLLASYEVAYGSPDSVQRDLGRYALASPASLGAAARALFVPGRLLVEVTPASPPPAAGKGGAR
jgi:predicted Zn-dependent peptidase